MSPNNLLFTPHVLIKGVEKAITLINLLQQVSFFSICNVSLLCVVKFQKALSPNVNLMREKITALLKYVEANVTKIEENQKLP